MGRKYDESWVGKKFGRLTVVEYLSKEGRFVCECVCGNRSVVVPVNLIRGKVKSCGCYNRDITRERMTVHGEHGTRLYRIYRAMKNRCYNPKDDSYPYYGGRGIKVCDEWLESYIAFRDWSITNGYSGDLSIDRIDNDGDYEPSNCRWVTTHQQAKNRRPASPQRYWTIDGVTKSEIEWCEEYGVGVNTARYRVRVMGLSPLVALTMEKVQSGRPSS